MGNDVDNQERKTRPGYLTAYSKHARITKTAAAEQLKRVGINYMQPFDFEEADRRREAARHADRAEFAKTSYVDPTGADGLSADNDGAPAAPDLDADGSPKDPVFAKIQARKEYYKAELARLEFEQVSGKLVEKEAVETEAFRIAQMVRDAVLNVPSRVAGIVAAETDQRVVHDLLDKELRQVLEALASKGDEGREAE